MNFNAVKQRTRDAQALINETISKIVTSQLAIQQSKDLLRNHVNKSSANRKDT